MNVPDILKVVLVDDWEAITKNNQVRFFRVFFTFLSLDPIPQLVSLPRSPTVYHLLEQWQDYMFRLDPKPPQ